jgi:tRNA G10  N-methylase Trm11
MTDIVAAAAWPNNAALIADCHRLGYLRDEWLTLDPTYGKGAWWKEYRPPRLVIHDKRIDGVDFRSLPEPDGHFDAIAFDPPYVSVGGRTTTSIPAFHDAYGLSEAPKTPSGVQELINEGLTEMYRVLRPQGFCLAKCQDYVSSGKLWIGTHYTLAHALELGFRLFDRFEHIAGIRPQPKRTRNGLPSPQIHARRNLSTLFVLQKPRKS